MTISSPHNDRLKEIRKLARRRSRERDGPVRGRGRGPAGGRRPRPAGRRSSGYCAAGSGLDGVEVEAELLAGVSQLGIGDACARRCSSSAGRMRRSGRCASRCTAIADPGNVGTILRSALAFGAVVRRARARLARIRTGRRRCGRRWARCSRVPLARVRQRRRAAGHDDRARRARRRAARAGGVARSRRRDARRSLVWRRARRACRRTSSPPATASRGSRSRRSRSTPRWRRPSRSTR